MSDKQAPDPTGFVSDGIDHRTFPAPTSARALRGRSQSPNAHRTFGSRPASPGFGGGCRANLFTRQPRRGAGLLADGQEACRETEAGPCRERPGADPMIDATVLAGRSVFEIVWREASLAGAVTTPRNRSGSCSACGTARCRDAERTLRNQPFRRIRCMWSRTLDAIEASSGGQRRALGDLGEVLVEEHPGDEFLA